MSILPAIPSSRRDLLRSMVGAAALAGAPKLVRAQTLPSIAESARARDWKWLEGNWHVHRRRLRERLAGNHHWDQFQGRSTVWLTLGGLGTIDDNILDLPGGTYRACGIRAYDPATDRWSIWWLDGRNPERIDPPVTGRFNGDVGTFTGKDVLRGRPIDVRFRWQDIHGQRPHWQQSFSPDGGATWEMNWENFFTRTSERPTPLPLLKAETLSAHRTIGPSSSAAGLSIIASSAAASRAVATGTCLAGPMSTGPCSAEMAMSATTCLPRRPAIIAGSGFAPMIRHRANGSAGSSTAAILRK